MRILFSFMRRYLLSLFLLTNITVFVVPTFAQFSVWKPFEERGIVMSLAYVPGDSMTDASSTTQEEGDDFACSDTK